MKKNKIYGYMIGYREIGSRFVRYYTTFTYKNALSSLRFYQKYPTRERETNRPLIDPVWEIQPITKKSILRSILDEIPFPRKNATSGDVFCYSWSLIHCNNSSYYIFPSAKRKPTSTTSSSVASSGIPFTSKYATAILFLD